MKNKPLKNQQLLNSYWNYLLNHSKGTLTEAGVSDRIIALIETFEATVNQGETNTQTLSKRFRMPENVCKQLLALHETAQIKQRV